MGRQQRGQVLPLWIAGILGTLALILTALNYGNTLRWHIRAQNAADSAAQAVLAIQSERWNEMLEVLYGMNVEEYRIRHLLDGILLASTLSANCNRNVLAPPPTSPVLPFYALTPDYNNVEGCNAVYQLLTPKYMKAVQRYSSEIVLLNKIASNATFANWQADAESLMNHLDNPAYCNTPGQAAPFNPSGGDCAFTYAWASAPFHRTGLSSVSADGQRIDIPTGARAPGPGGYDSENQNLFAPAQVDVVTCALVPPLFPTFFGITTPPFYAIGRATATNVMFVEEWFEPGALTDPEFPGATPFQPIENYVPHQYSDSAPGAPPSAQQDSYYAVNFGGNAASPNGTNNTFSAPVVSAELSARLGWWNSIPLHPTNPNGAPIMTDCPGESH